MLRIALRYCGCCNPQVNLSRIAAGLVRDAGKLGFEVVPPGGAVDITVLLCGCPRACARKGLPQGNALLVAGESLEGKAVAESDLLPAIEARLLRFGEEVLKSYPARREKFQSTMPL